MKPFTILLCALLMASACTHKPSSEELTIGLNEPIHHDDFEYVITDFHTAKKIGRTGNEKEANGKFYIVSFLVKNNAKRVNHEWDNSIAYLIDRQGRIYENNKSAQQFLEETNSFGWQEKYVTPRSSSQSTILVFEVPEAIETPFLQVRGPVLMGDVFDNEKFTKTKVRLFQ